MAKPYFLFKMPSGIWYARLQLSDALRQTTNRQDAETEHPLNVLLWAGL